MSDIISTYYLHFDTEFANFSNLSPLSIGIVSEDKKFEFYKEINDFKLNDCSDFVCENIIPLLDLEKHGQPYAEVSQSLIKWINELPCKDVIFVADYMGDIVIIERLLSLPGDIKLQKKVITKLLNKAFIQATQERGIYNHKSIHKAFQAMADGITVSLGKQPEMQHHSLYDAHANCDGWKSGMKKLM